MAACKMLISVCGSTCSGKTTLVRAMSGGAGIPAYLPGQLCREKFGERAMAAADNPLTPAETEDFVRGELLAYFAVGGSVIVDGMPRSPEQVSFIKASVKLYHYSWLVLHLAAPKTDQLYARMKKRDTSDNEIALTHARIQKEGDQLWKTQTALAKAEIPVLEVTPDVNWAWLRPYL